MARADRTGKYEGEYSMKRWAVILSPYPMGPEFEWSRHWTRYGAQRAAQRIIFSDTEAVTFIRRIE
jgi:hypothetical protein